MALNAETHVNVADLLKKAVERQPDKRAVVSLASRDHAGRAAYSHLTFRQLDRESDRLAHGLDTVGISRGVRTILMVKPGIEFFILTFALFKTGAVPVVVDPGMGLRRMPVCLQEARPQAFIGIPLAHVLRVLFPGFFKTVGVRVTVGRRYFWGGYTFRQLMNRPDRPYGIAPTTRDELAAILFTTGSTGPAKGAEYTHGNFVAQIREIEQYIQPTPDEIDLPTFPLFALFDPAMGMTAVIPDMDPTKPGRVDPRKIIEPIVNHGVTNMFGSPALIDRVGRYGVQNAITLPSLKRVFSAGAPVHADNIERFSRLLEGGAQVHTPYGATECVPVSAIGSDEILDAETRAQNRAGKGVCVGRPLSGVHVHIIRITDEPIARWSDDLILSDGQIGEIVVQADNASRAYFHRPRDTSLAKIADGGSFRHRMGDLGRLDDHGRIWFCGRKSHRVTTPQGELFTVCVEEIFNQHPRVLRSALVGIGPRPCQEPVIMIELHGNDSGRHLDILKNELLEKAAGHDHTKSIRNVLFHPSFPVDIRHNSKIFREKLAVWAMDRLAREKGGRR
jgi:olefin beta-lactone synthetase